MKKKIAVAFAAMAAAVAMLVPISSHAAASAACIVVNGPSGLHLQLGYAPHGPSDCTHIP